MNPLTFTLKIQPKFTLDVAQLTPDNLAGLKKREIKSLMLPYGKNKVTLDTLFSVTGTDSNNIHINRSCEKLILVGRNMSYGTINVNGDVGKILGSYLQGGFITINGNAGSWVGNNMSGGPGNMQTTLDTINAVEGMPLHLTHVQFHSYDTEGDRKFSSGAAQIAEAVNSNPNISIDVGQVLFGQTVTASGDTMMQYSGHWHAHPKKWVIMDIECDAGCGVVPFKYRDKNFVNALQWAIGLELFLLISDPWRIFLTTDHPNGAPFISYPHLIRLLMDRSFRNDMLATINKSAAAASVLNSIDREYTLYEIATMTRAAPARSLGLKHRGHLGGGAIADITVYNNLKNKEKMFEKPLYVFKNGEEIVKNGKIVKVVTGGTHTLRPDYDKSIEQSLKKYFDRYMTVKLGNFKIDDDEIVEHGNSNIIVQPCT